MNCLLHNIGIIRLHAEAAEKQAGAYIKENAAMFAIVRDTSCYTTECASYDRELEDCTGHPGCCPVVQEAMQ
jgi:hypothetical protein